MDSSLFYLWIFLTVFNHFELHVEPVVHVLHLVGRSERRAGAAQPHGPEVDRIFRQRKAATIFVETFQCVAHRSKFSLMVK